jgi:hypothetical protein
MEIRMKFIIDLFIEDDGFGEKQLDCGNEVAEETNFLGGILLCCLKHKEEYIKNGDIEIV